MRNSSVSGSLPPRPSSTAHVHMPQAHQQRRQSSAGGIRRSDSTSSATTTQQQQETQQNAADLQTIMSASSVLSSGNLNDASANMRTSKAGGDIRIDLSTISVGSIGVTIDNNNSTNVASPTTSKQPLRPSSSSSSLMLTSPTQIGRSIAGQQHQQQQQQTASSSPPPHTGPTVVRAYSPSDRHAGINFSPSSVDAKAPPLAAAQQQERQPGGGGGGGGGGNPHDTFTASELSLLQPAGVVDTTMTTAAGASPSSFFQSPPPFKPISQWPETLHERVLRARLAISDLFDAEYERSNYDRGASSTMLAASPLTMQRRSTVQLIQQRPSTAGGGGDSTLMAANSNNTTIEPNSLSLAQNKAHLKLLRSRVVHVLHQLADTMRVDDAVAEGMEEVLRNSNVSQSLMGDGNEKGPTIASAAATTSSSSNVRVKPNTVSALMRGLKGFGAAPPPPTAGGENNTMSQARFDLLMANMRVKLSEKYREVEALKAFCKRKDSAIDTLRTSLLQDVMNLKKENIEMQSQNQNLQFALSREKEAANNGGGGSAAINNGPRGSNFSGGTNNGLSNASFNSQPLQQATPTVNASATFLTSSSPSLSVAPLPPPSQQQPTVLVTPFQTQTLQQNAMKEYLTIFDYLRLFEGDDPDPERQEGGALRIAERHHREVVQRLNIDNNNMLLLKEREIELLRREIQHLNGEVVNAQNKKYMPANTFLMYRLGLMRAAANATKTKTLSAAGVTADNNGVAEKCMALALEMGKNDLSDPNHPSHRKSSVVDGAAENVDGEEGSAAALKKSSKQKKKKKKKDSINGLNDDSYYADAKEKKKKKRNQSSASSSVVAARNMSLVSAGANNEEEDGDESEDSSDEEEAEDTTAAAAVARQQQNLQHDYGLHNGWDPVANAPHGVVLPDGVSINVGPRTGEELESDLVFVMRELDKRVAQCSLLSDKLEREKADASSRSKSDRHSLVKEQQAVQELSAQLEERETECSQLQETVATLQRALVDAQDTRSGDKSLALKGAEMESVLRLNAELQTDTIPRITMERDALATTVAELTAKVAKLEAEANGEDLLGGAGGDGAAGNGASAKGGGGTYGPREIAALVKSNALLTKQVQRFEQESRMHSQRAEEEKQRSAALASEMAELRQENINRSPTISPNQKDKDKRNSSVAEFGSNNSLVRRPSNLRRSSSVADLFNTPAGGGDREMHLKIQVGELEDQLALLKEEKKAQEEEAQRTAQKVKLLEKHLKEAAEMDEGVGAAKGGVTGGGVHDKKELKGMVFHLQNENTTLHTAKMALEQQNEALEAKNLDLLAEIKALKAQLSLEKGKTATIGTPKATDTIGRGDEGEDNWFASSSSSNGGKKRGVGTSSTGKGFKKGGATTTTGSSRSAATVGINSRPVSSLQQKKDGGNVSNNSSNATIDLATTSQQAEENRVDAHGAINNTTAGARGGSAGQTRRGSAASSHASSVRMVSLSNLEAESASVLFSAKPANNSGGGTAAASAPAAAGNTNANNAIATTTTTRGPMTVVTTGGGGSAPNGAPPLTSLISNNAAVVTKVGGGPSSLKPNGDSYSDIRVDLGADNDSDDDGSEGGGGGSGALSNIRRRGSNSTAAGGGSAASRRSRRNPSAGGGGGGGAAQRGGSAGEAPAPGPPLFQGTFFYGAEQQQSVTSSPSTRPLSSSALAKHQQQNGGGEKAAAMMMMSMSSQQLRTPSASSNRNGSSGPLSIGATPPPPPAAAAATGGNNSRSAMSSASAPPSHSTLPPNVIPTDANGATISRTPAPVPTATLPSPSVVSGNNNSDAAANANTSTTVDTSAGLANISGIVASSPSSGEGIATHPLSPLSAPTPAAGGMDAAVLVRTVTTAGDLSAHKLGTHNAAASCHHRPAASGDNDNGSANARPSSSSVIDLLADLPRPRSVSSATNGDRRMVAAVGGGGGVPVSSVGGAVGVSSHPPPPSLRPLSAASTSGVAGQQQHSSSRPPSAASSIITESNRPVHGEKDGDMAVTRDKHHSHSGTATTAPTVTASASKRGGSAANAATTDRKRSTSTVMYTGFSPKPAVDINNGGRSLLPPRPSLSSSTQASPPTASQSIATQTDENSLQLALAPQHLDSAGVGGGHNAGGGNTNGSSIINDTNTSSQPIRSGGGGERGGGGSPPRRATSPVLYPILGSLRLQQTHHHIPPIEVRDVTTVGVMGQRTMDSGGLSLHSNNNTNNNPSSSSAKYQSVVSRFPAMHHAYHTLGVYNGNSNNNNSSAASNPLHLSPVEEEEMAAALATVGNKIFAPSPVLQKYWARQWVQQHADQFERYYTELVEKRRAEEEGGGTDEASFLATEEKHHKATTTPPPSASQGNTKSKSGKLSSSFGGSAPQQRLQHQDKFKWMDVANNNKRDANKSSNNDKGGSNLSSTADGDVKNNNNTSTDIEGGTRERPLAGIIAGIERRHSDLLLASEARDTADSSVPPLASTPSSPRTHSRPSSASAAAKTARRPSSSSAATRPVSRPSSSQGAAVATAAEGLAMPPSVHVRTSSAGGGAGSRGSSRPQSPTHDAATEEKEEVSTPMGTNDTAEEDQTQQQRNTPNRSSSPSKQQKSNDSATVEASASPPPPNWRTVARNAEIAAFRANIKLDEELRRAAKERQARQLALAGGRVPPGMQLSHSDGDGGGDSNSSSSARPARLRDEVRKVSDGAEANAAAADVGGGGGGGEFNVPHRGTLAATPMRSAPRQQQQQQQHAAGDPSSPQLSHLPHPQEAESSANDGSSLLPPPPPSVPATRFSSAASATSPIPPKHTTLDVRNLVSDIYRVDQLLPEDVAFERKIAAAAAARRIGGAAGAGNGDPNGGGTAGKRQQQRLGGGGKAAATVRGVREKVQAQISVAKFMQTFPDLHPLPAQSPNSHAPVKSIRK